MFLAPWWNPRIYIQHVRFRRKAFQLSSMPVPDTKKVDLGWQHRAVGAGGPDGGHVPPGFEISLNPTSTRGFTTLLLAPLNFQIFLRHCASLIWLRWLDESITLVHINWKKHYLCTLFMYINNTFRHKNNNKSVAVKGHLISKCLLGFFNFLQKTSENKSTWVYIVVEENSFDCFLEEMSARKNNFDFFRPLSKRKLVRRVTENKWKIVIQCDALRKKEDLPQG